MPTKNFLARRAMGMAAMTGLLLSSALLAPTAQAGGSGAALPKEPLNKATASSTHREWVLTLKPGSQSAKSVAKASANANVLPSLDQDVKSSVAEAAQQEGAKVTAAKADANNRVTVQLNKAVTDQVADDLAADADVLKAEPVIATSASVMTSTPNDTYFGLQWGLTGSKGIHADKVWPTNTGEGQTVAVLDTGITNHPDLTGRTSGGYDFISNSTTSHDGNGRDADPHDAGDWNTAGQCGTGSAAESSSWHGTHVASIIAASGNNSTGITGVAPGATVEPVRVLGACGGSSVDIADAITWASGGTVAGVPANPKPAKVINLSLGGSYPSCPSYYQAAIDGARARGTSVVVAAGNSGVSAANSTPGNCKGVITVAATGQTGTRAYYSNYGSAVELAAPGGDDSTGHMIAGAANSGTTGPSTPDYVYMEGTSQAAPHVAGAIALLLKAKPGLTPDQVTSLLRSTATATGDSSIGSGIVNVQAAIAKATATTTAAATTTRTVTTRLAAPATARRGTTVVLTLSGYAARERVALTFDGRASGYATVGSTGTVKVARTIATTTTVARHTWAGKGVTSKRAASAVTSVTR